MIDLAQVRADLLYAQEQSDPNDPRAWNAFYAAEAALAELETKAHRLAVEWERLHNVYVATAKLLAIREEQLREEIAPLETDAAWKWNGDQ